MKSSPAIASTKDKAHRQPAPPGRGDCIGIIFPAGPIHDRQRFTAGLNILRQLGFTILCRTEIPASGDYLAADDDDRAAELMALWRDPRVKAVMAARGGYGCLRLLDRLDFSLFTALPKLLVGFSDITVLHSAIGSRCNMVTIHGPVVASLADSGKDNIRQFAAMLTGSRYPAIPVANLEVLRSGRARAPLVGGNLTSLCHLLGSPYEPDWQDVILFLEDIGEAPYRVDRMLTHLYLAGKLERISGLILGSFTDCGPPETIWQRVLELTGDIPVWANFPAGHGQPNLALPLGATAEMDSDHATLRFPREYR